MFTGIVETTGRVLTVKPTARGRRIRIQPAKVLRGVRLGESIAVNGVCLTVARLSLPAFEFDVIRETLRLTDLGSLEPGGEVNLERALKYGDRLSGHYVMGHVEAKARVLGVERDGRETEVRIEAPSSIGKWIVLKGCVAVNGISLTVSRRGGKGFSVHIIPHTWAETNLKSLKIGSYVNLETDILLKTGRGQKLFSIPPAPKRRSRPRSRR